MGVWIETGNLPPFLKPVLVTPCVGVWIETSKIRIGAELDMSHPAWVCGLKPEKD